MQEFIIDIINKYGYLGISLLIAIENLFPPIPSEIILTFGGFITLHSTLNVWLVILFATIGSVAGAIALYVIGRILNAERLKRILSRKIGRVLRLKPDDVERADMWFTRHGKKTVFFCRFIPIIRSLISIPAGISKMRFLIFLPLTALGSLIWNTVLILLGKLAGDMWSKIAGYFDIYSTVALIIILLLCVTLAAIFIKRRFLTQKPAESVVGTPPVQSQENEPQHILEQAPNLPNRSLPPPDAQSESTELNQGAVSEQSRRNQESDINIENQKQESEAGIEENRDK